MNPAPLVLMSLKHISFHRLLHLKKEKGKACPSLLFLRLHFYHSFRRLERVLLCKAGNDLLKGPLIIKGFISLTCLEVSLIVAFLFFFSPPYTKGTLFVIGLLTAERGGELRTLGSSACRSDEGSAGCSLNIAPSFAVSCSSRMCCCRCCSVIEERPGKRSTKEYFIYLFICFREKKKQQ